MGLHHFSEDPGIAVFRPHVAKTSSVQETLVWAIDDWHAPMYYVPRDCPRACFWADERTTAVDREHWLHGLAPRFVMAVEASGVDRIRGTVLNRHEMSPTTFASRLDVPTRIRCGRSPVTAHGLPDEFILGLFAAGIAVMFCGVIATSIWRRADVTSDQLFWAGTNAAAHPERYVRPDRVMAVRVLNTTGVSLFLGAVLLLLAQAVRRLL